MLGDLGYGPGDPSLAAYGSGSAPNLHALAQRFGVAGNIFAEAAPGGLAELVVTGGLAAATACARRRPRRAPSARLRR